MKNEIIMAKTSNKCFESVKLKRIRISLSEHLYLGYPPAYCPPLAMKSVWMFVLIVSIRILNRLI
jgi:hypothetical protein